MTLAHAGATLLFDAELVTYRLEEAGATLLALPGTGWSTRLRASSLEIVRAAVESYGWSEKHIRPPIPSAARITRMDEALAWIPLIPSTATCCGASSAPAAWCTRSPSATSILGAVSPPRSAPTTRRLSAGTPRGSS